MKRIFGMETRLARFLSFVWSLIVLNIITLVGCIPIVTIGASLTAMHYCLLKLLRDEESYITTMYWHAFKSNFKQSTILWIMTAVLFLSYRLDWSIITNSNGTLGKPAQYFVIIIAILTFMLIQFIFPLQSHFENSIFGTITNAVILCISKFPRVLVMTLIWVIPYEVLTHSMVLFPLILLLGISAPGAVCARMYEPVFKALEPEEEPEE